MPSPTNHDSSLSRTRRENTKDVPSTVVYAPRCRDES